MSVRYFVSMCMAVVGLLFWIPSKTLHNGGKGFAS